MAQTNYTPISLYYSTTASAVPLDTNLVNGELAINITDGKLYYKDNTGTVRLLAGTGGAGIAAGSNTQIQYNNSGAFGASASLTFDGTTFSAPNSVITSSSSSTALRVTQTGSGDALVIEDSSTPDATPFKINNAGNISTYGTILKGYSLASSVSSISGNLTPEITAQGTTAAASFLALNNWQNSSTAAAGITLTKSKSATGIGFRGAVVSGDNIGSLNFSSDDGTNFVLSGYIAAQADANATTGIAPGRLIFATTNSSGVTSEAMRLNSAGNLGLGVTPSAGQFSSIRGMEIGRAGSGISGRVDTISDVLVSANAVRTAVSGYTYGTTDFASFYRQVNGTHFWATAASGTAGNAISFTQAMTLDASGNLGIGTTSPGARLEVATAQNTNALIVGNRSLNTSSALVYLSTSSIGSAMAMAAGDGIDLRMPSNVANSVRNAFAAESYAGAGSTDWANVQILLGSSNSSNSRRAAIAYIGEDNALTFRTGATGLNTAQTLSGTERMRITSTGAFAINGATSYGTSGQVLTSAGNAPPTWTTPTTGTVTSVAQTFTGGLISVGGSPITGSGTLALTVAGTSGGIPYFSSASTWASSAALAANALVVGGGAGAAPATVTTGTGVVTALGVNTGSAGAFVVNGGALGTPSSGTLTNATGLPISTGVSGLGTGVATALGNAANATGGFATINGTATLTNKRINPRTSTATSTASLTPDISSFDQYNLTAQAATLTINAPTGTPVDGNKLVFRILDNGTSQTLSWNATYTVVGVVLPTATTANKMLYVGAIYNSANTGWDVVAVTTQA